MTNYFFPRIETFSDVEPFIDDYFIVKEKEGITFINYKHMAPEVFPPVVDYGTSVRREFRGIAFDSETGKIVSRPFHKFFNRGEKPDEGDLSDGPHWVEVKFDGSMIRPIPVGDGFRLATKAGITDVAMWAEEFVSDKPDLCEYINNTMRSGHTPIFEYFGPKNKVVLNYEEGMQLLAVRENISGNYKICDNGIKTNFSYLDALEDVEGVVVVSPTGHRQKEKTDWYVKRHRAKDLFDNERKFVKILLDDDLDDVLPMLSEEDKIKALDLCGKFWEELETSVTSWCYLMDEVRLRWGTKKDFALDCPWSKNVKSGVFSIWDSDEEGIEKFMVERVRKSLSTLAKYQEFKEIEQFEWSVTL